MTTTLLKFINEAATEETLLRMQSEILGEPSITFVDEDNEEDEEDEKDEKPALGAKKVLRQDLRFHPYLALWQQSLQFCFASIILHRPEVQNQW